MMWRGIFLALLLSAGAVPATALEIQKVESAGGGITAWLVEDHTQPLIAISASFGKPPDPKNYSGLSSMMASLLSKGAGGLNFQTFQGEIEDLSIKMNFNAAHDSLSAQMMTLKKNQARAFELLGLALVSPAFETDQIEKVRAQHLSLAASREQNLSSFARQQFYVRTFAPSTYAYPKAGLAKDIKKIKRTLLQRGHKKIITRANLHISVVGAITPDDLAQLLDKTFAPLPAGKKLPPAKPIKRKNKTGKPHFISRPKNDGGGGQSAIYFATRGLKRDHPAFMSYYLMHYMFGGGQNSRLFKIARERFGLVYSIHTRPITFAGGGFLVGTAATQNKQRADLLRLVRRLTAQTRKQGFTPKELAQAKTYLIGSYGLAFDTSLSIANNLTYLQRQKLGTDYIKKRKTLIQSVKLAEVNSIARKFLNYDKMTLVIVGGKTNAKKARNSRR